MHLDELGDDLKAVGLGESVESQALGFDPEASFYRKESVSGPRYHDRRCWGFRLSETAIGLTNVVMAFLLVAATPPRCPSITPPSDNSGFSPWFADREG